MNRQQRVLGYLMRRPGVCMQDVPSDLAYTLRNGIAELRKAGHEIESERCTFHNHESPIFRYRLTQPAQQEIPL